MLPGNALTLIRYDEVGLKGKNRRFFEGRLRENIARNLGLATERVTCERGRIFVATEDGAPLDAAGARALSRTFGIRSFSPVQRVAPALDAIVEAALALAAQARRRGAASFAVDSRRSHKAFPLTSLELNVRVGRAVQDAHPELVVHLDDPEFTLHVEVREASAYVYELVVPGPGGLPSGTGGRALLLLSGGIDSPVAGWFALKRGVALDAVHFHSPPYTGARAREKAVALARELAGWRSRPLRLHVVSLSEAQARIAGATPERLWTVLLRRVMMRAAAAIAARERHEALVTGDSVGQVASQTLENLRAADAAVAIPVLRPLVGFDKAEIVEQARRIGTFGLSIQPYEDCCVLFAPKSPATRARPEELERAESALPIPEVVARAVEGAEALDVDTTSARESGARQRLEEQTASAL